MGETVRPFRLVGWQYFSPKLLPWPPCWFLHLPLDPLCLSVRPAPSVPHGHRNQYRSHDVTWLLAALSGSPLVLRTKDMLLGFTASCMSQPAYLPASPAVPAPCSLLQPHWVISSWQSGNMLCTLGVSCPLSSLWNDFPISIMTPGTPPPPSSSVPGAGLLGVDPQLWFLLVMSPSTSQSLHFLIWKMVRFLFVSHGVLMRIKRASPGETFKEYLAHIKRSKQLAVMAGFCLCSYPPHSLWAWKPCLSPLRLCIGPGLYYALPYL